MITIERLGEIIRKYQVLTDMEQDATKKQVMNRVLTALKMEHQIIIKDNTPCPPDIAAELEIYFAQIEEQYDKIAAN